jgi:hypothetical protein
MIAHTILYMTDSAGSRFVYSLMSDILCSDTASVMTPLGARNFSAPFNLMGS